MVDLFAVNDFVRFLKKEYPEINVSVTYIAQYTLN